MNDLKAKGEKKFDLVILGGGASAFLCSVVFLSYSGSDSILWRLDGAGFQNGANADTTREYNFWTRAADLTMFETVNH